MATPTPTPIPIAPPKLVNTDANNDGVDYVTMGKQKNALIQLLNIAGTGPIFGPIMGALFGPSSMEASTSR